MHGEIGKAVSTTALLIELAERKRPTCFLPPPVLPDDSIEPALNTAGQVKVGWIDAQHKPLVDNAVIEPVGQDKLKAQRTALLVGDFFPFIEPAKVMALFPFALSDTGKTLVDFSLSSAAFNS